MRRQSLLLLPAVFALVAAAPVRIPKSTLAIHDRLIVLDTHFDTPANLGRPGWSIMDRHSAAQDGDQVDHPRMVSSGVDGGFFAIFTGQGARNADADARARDFAIGRGIQIREMVAKHADAFELALTADDALRIAAAGKRFVFISMENGYPFEGDLTLMRLFRGLGVTMMSPAHFLNNDLADSATDPKGAEWHGLSPKGRDFVKEANRLGILIDMSHSSDEALRQAVELSRTPIILSHSGMRAIYDHPRNVSDADARLVAAHGGVIQINAFNNYMIAAPKIAERDAAFKALGAKFEKASAMTVAERRALIAERNAIDARWPVPRADFDDFMKHVLHAIALVGIDHVGMSGDFDGGGGIEGLEDITGYPRVTAALLAAGYSGEDVGKFWGGNVLRAMRAAQAVAEPGAIPVVPITN